MGWRHPAARFYDCLIVVSFGGEAMGSMGNGSMFVPNGHRQLKHQIKLSGIGTWLLLRVCLVAALAGSPITPLLQAQLYTGSVTGLVTDPSGGSIPSAKITLVDINKGYSFTATTDATGRYLVRSVPPGTYKITAEASNFERESKDGVTVDVSQNVSIDFALKVGTTIDTVEVKADTVQLQTEDAVTGQVVNRKFVNDL